MPHYTHNNKHCENNIHNNEMRDAEGCCVYIKLMDIN